MIYYINTEDQIECIYCKSVDSCEHLFAVYDETFDALEGGFLYNDNRVEEILRYFFISVINSYGLFNNLKFLKCNEVNDIWNEILEYSDYYMDENTFIESDFSLPSINRYMFQKLDDINLPEYGEFEGGPGQSSAYNVYYSDKPQQLADTLINSIKTELNRFYLEIAIYHEKQKAKRKKRGRKKE